MFMKFSYIIKYILDRIMILYCETNFPHYKRWKSFFFFKKIKYSAKSTIKLYLNPIQICIRLFDFVIRVVHHVIMINHIHKWLMSILLLLIGFVGYDSNRNYILFLCYYYNFWVFKFIKFYQLLLNDI